MRLIRLVLLSLVLSFVVTAGGVRAQDTATPEAATPTTTETPRLGIRPIDYEGYFTLEMKPGEKKKLTVELGNYGTQAVEARTYAADVYTLINGGFGVRLDGEAVSGTTLWLDYPADTFTIDPGAAQQRTFTVEVPKDTAPGDYITSVVLQPADPIKGTGGLAIDQVVRQALAVFITVPGDRNPELTIGAASYKEVGAGSNIQVAVANTGNTLLKPTGKFELTDDSGASLLKADLTLDSFYAHTESAVEVGITTPLPPGTYHVRLSLEADGAQASEEDIPFTVAEPATPVAVAAETIEISSVQVNEIRGSDGALQAVEIVVSIDNPGQPVDNAQLSLSVMQDGQPVETIVLGSSLSFPGGPAEFRQRYLPLTGWTSGEWTFSVSLEQTDPTSGATITLATADADQPVTVP